MPNEEALPAALAEAMGLDGTRARRHALAKSAWAWGLSTALGIAHAQAPTAAAAAPAPSASAPIAFQPGAWTLGSWKVTPQLALAAGYNDNIRLQSTDASASPFVAAFPTLQADRTVGEDHYDLQWHGEWTHFTRSSDDDTTNDELAADGLQVLDAHTATAWRAVWQDWHENLGLARTDEVAGSPAHVHSAALDLVWRHDLDPPAGARFEVEPGISFKHYLDQREITREADQSTFDFTARALGTLSPLDRAGLEMRFERNRFPAGTLAGDNHGVRAMALWQRDSPAEGAAAASDGHAGLGFETRAFDQYRPPYGGLTWDIGWNWPAGSNTLALQGRREALDAPTEDVDEMVDEHVTASISRTWSSSGPWAGSLSLTLGHDHYVGALFPRDDHLNALDLTLRHDLSRRWQLTFALACVQRRALVGAFDFTRWLTSVELAGAI
jgi:hypothetical protein